FGSGRLLRSRTRILAGFERLDTSATSGAASGKGVVEQAPEQRPLTGLHDVTRFQRNPKTLEACGFLLTVVILLAPPPFRGGVGQVQVEDVSALELEPVGPHVVLGLAELAHDREVLQPGFLLRFTQRGLLRGFPRANAARRDLDTDLFPGVVDVPEDQQPSRPDDVAENFFPGDHFRHVPSPPSSTKDHSFPFRPPPPRGPARRRPADEQAPAAQTHHAKLRPTNLVDAHGAPWTRAVQPPCAVLLWFPRGSPRRAKSPSPSRSAEAWDSNRATEASSSWMGQGARVVRAATAPTRGRRLTDRLRDKGDVHLTRVTFGHLRRNAVRHPFAGRVMHHKVLRIRRRPR